jgi:glycosyltransferase involved in cell wall biosynthesis
VRVLAQPNSGLGAARNAGIAVSRGRYVLTLDADDVLHPTFVERCVACLEADPSIAYATSWLRYVDERGRPDPRLGEGWQAYSNASDVLHDVNTAGSAIAVFRRRLFANAFAYDTDLTSYEDWVLFRELRDAGHVGHVIPERLIDYRIRAASMMRQTGLPQAERIRQEVDASQRRKQVEWTSSSA